MTSGLDTALASLAARLEVGDVARYVHRVDVRSSGAIDVSLSLPGDRRWFRFHEERLTELAPRLDPKLPLSKELRGTHGRSVEVLGYRPRRRLVVASRCSDTRVVLKGVRSDRLRRTELAYRAAERSTRGDGFRVPRVLEERPDRAALCLEYLAGKPLPLDGTGARHFFSTGVALRRLQDAACDPELRAFRASDELAVLDRMAERSVVALGGVPEDWLDLRRRLEDPPSGEEHTALCHRDLHDRQLLRTSEGIALLDFDDLCRGDVALDPANLLAHLSLRALQRTGLASEESALACGDALLDGLDRGRESSFWVRLRFYQATTFLRLALLYRLRPRWAHLWGPLVDLARHCADDRARIEG